MGPVRRKMYGRDYYDEKCHYDDRRRSRVSHHHRPNHQERKSLYVPLPIDDSDPKSHTMMYVLGSVVTLFLFVFVGILLCGAGGAFTRPPPPVAYQQPVVVVQPRYDPL